MIPIEANLSPSAAPAASLRPVLRADIVESRSRDSLDCSGPSDFTLGMLQPIEAKTAAAAKLLPYCFDALSRRSLYLEGLDIEQARTAPFYYLYARKAATGVVMVPWERGPLSEPDETDPPVLLFSSGRCGSTLLTGLLAEAGVPTVSEPDIYTQYTAGCLFENKPDFYRGPVRQALSAMARDLTAALGGAPVVKLRAEVCFAVRPLLAGAAAPLKTLFMIRDIEPWARSSLRIFDYAPEQTLAKYTLGLKCLAVQRQLSDCHTVRYEALLQRPAQTCAALASFLGRAIAPEAIARAMARDAQAGTPLARGLHAPQPDHEAKLAEILRLWREPKHDALRALAESL